MWEEQKKAKNDGSIFKWDSIFTTTAYFAKGETRFWVKIKKKNFKNAQLR